MNDPLYRLRANALGHSYVDKTTALMAYDFSVAEIRRLTDQCDRLREFALAGTRPNQGGITSPESVRWFNAYHKCYTNGDFTGRSD